MPTYFNPKTLRTHPNGTIQTLGVDGEWYPSVETNISERKSANSFNVWTGTKRYVDTDGYGIKRASGELNWKEDVIAIPDHTKEFLFYATRDTYWFIVGTDTNTKQDLLLGVGTGQNNICLLLKKLDNGEANVQVVRKPNYFNTLSEPRVMGPAIRGNHLRTRREGGILHIDMSKDKINWEVVAMVDGSVHSSFGKKLGLQFGVSSLVGGREGTTPIMLCDFTIKEPQETGPIPHHDDKYVIFAVAGEGNALGKDESAIKPPYRIDWNPRIIQITWGNQSLYGTDSIIDVHNIQGLGKISGIHAPLCNEMLKYIPDDYKVLVIPVAHGDSGFNNGTDGTYDITSRRAPRQLHRWGKTSAYYKMLKDRVSMLLDQNPKNRFAGVVWIQGESDIANPSNHKAKFEEMTNDFISFINTKYGDRCKEGKFTKKLWFNVESTKYWKAQQGYQTILQNYKAWSPESYVEIPDDTDTNEVNGTGKSSPIKAAHYGNGAYYKIIAPRVVKKMIECGAI